MSQPLIDLQHISKSFDGELILDDLNLSIRENSFVTLHLDVDHGVETPYQKTLV